MNYYLQIFKSYSLLSKGLIVLMLIYAVRGISGVMFLGMRLFSGSLAVMDLLYLLYLVIPLSYLAAAFLQTKVSKMVLMIVNFVFGSLLVFGLLFSFNYEGGFSGPAGLMIPFFGVLLLLYLLCQVSVREVLRVGSTGGNKSKADLEK